MIGNESWADDTGIIIGHGIYNDEPGHVQIGNSSFVTGNIGNRPIDLQGEILTQNLTIPSN